MILARWPPLLPMATSSVADNSAFSPASDITRGATTNQDTAQPIMAPSATHRLE